MSHATHHTTFRLPLETRAQLRALASSACRDNLTIYLCELIAQEAARQGIDLPPGRPARQGRPRQLAQDCAGATN